MGDPCIGVQVGSLLRKVEGSVCSRCYAHKGRYAFPAVQRKLQGRLDAYRALGDGGFVLVMSELLERVLPESLPEPERCFRWFDSGDLQDLDMLIAVVVIAHLVPHVRFWLPTKERALVESWHRWAGADAFPSNLVVRIAEPMIGRSPARRPANPIRTSTVNAHKRTRGSWACPAHEQGNKCGDCRACWSHAIRNVDYPLK